MYKSGRNQEVFEITMLALGRPDADHIIKVLFALAVTDLQIAKDNPQVKNSLLKVLLEEGIEYQRLSKLWRSAVMLDPLFSPFFNLVSKSDISDEDWDALQEPLSSQLLLEGIKKIGVDSEIIEKVITNLRRITLLQLLPAGKLQTKHIAYICAMAEQCFFNEYAYYVDDDEKEALAALSQEDPISVAILGCYEPLHQYNISPKFSPLAPLKHLLKIQVAAYQREQEIKETIPRLGAIVNDISQNVQAMYEENPYPRWRNQNIAFPRKSSPGKVLIAGCGTGKFTMSLAWQIKDMDLTAIDISRSSIAYAQRTAEEYGIKNTNFIQCDILNINELPENYDFINCSGVIHHMKDPMAGWRKLIEKLKSGGMMLMGLYSKTARDDIEEAQKFARDRGYKPVVDDIRQFRRDIYNLPPEHSLRKLLKVNDFYQVSGVRDMVFHIQEKTYDIPEIQAALDELGLEFMGFRIANPQTVAKYKAAYPDDPSMRNLNNWHAFEQKEPGSSLEMYNFWCRRKSDNQLTPAMQEIVNMGI